MHNRLLPWLMLIVVLLIDPAVHGQVGGDGIDNDGDGAIDEEIQDGIDNDGDGLIDEDVGAVRFGNGGVYIDPDGVVRQRELDKTKELVQMRERARDAVKHRARRKLSYVSLPALTEKARALIKAGTRLPNDIRYMGGLTRIDFVLLYPESGDLVIAGPAEPIVNSNSIQPVGKLTGRPVLQLDDLVVALRTANTSRKGQVSLGCSIDAPADATANTMKVVRRYGAIANRAEKHRLYRDVLRAIGPHHVRVFGVPADTRLAWVCVTADYKMKRLSFGVDPEPVRNLGHALDSSGAGGNRFWFEASYDPLRVSPDGLAYALSGKRMMLKCSYGYTKRPATRQAQTWTRKVNVEMDKIADAMPLFADLQNVADLMVLASLVKTDQLDKKVKWDTAWLMDPKAYKVGRIPTPKTAQTILVDRKKSFVTGGVVFSTASIVQPEAREITKVKRPALKPDDAQDAAEWQKIKEDH